ncbi:FAD-binding oxidoreductase [Aggregicoccus sp. 17bor-14]|uniref:FAD-binding and (Fe-S)-binding domain-containing protein n=1 Tax=Myxococcaceae TaxID=31 RepID=UPI00129CA16D|nr:MULTISPECIES: FAD-binding and (Fe-S)-binding domain-containing protein [Myxococcaceae]MBF5046499.1 FAD-binding oxidoreductase [Simulacricoccus sp. 17bor-14]MRI92215.1 FAD-binding oxidoreductase [Aggregicoccus sp. 17bor-14]
MRPEPPQQPTLPPPSPSTPPVRHAQEERRALDLRGLERALRRRLRGGEEGDVQFDAGARALYATDASNYRQVPLGVVRPRSAEDIAQVVRTCREFGAPVLSRGGGTSLAGQCCNVAVVMDLTRHYGRLLSIDPERRTARVQPGIVLDDLRSVAVQRHGLTFGPDPATHNRCTLGGMLGNNSCGMHAQMAGRTSDNVEALEVLTYDGLRLKVGATSEEELARLERQGGRVGELYRGMRRLRDRYAPLIRERYPDIPRRISGYNLDELLPEKGFQVARALVGSEGTLVTILEATLRLVPNPRVRSLLVLGYPDVYRAADHLPRVLQSGPIALEGLDDVLLDGMRRKGLDVSDLSLLPEGRGWLMVEFGGDSREEADAQARALMEALKREPHAPHMSLFDDPAQEKLLWEVRESGLGATAFIPGEPDAWPGWEDAAVPPDRVGGYLRDFRALLGRHGYHAALYGHFGQGCIHCRINFGLRSKEGLRNYRRFAEEAADLVVRYGGSLSGEHGDGQSRAELLPKMFGDELVRAMGEFKALWDPLNRMNPHKVVDPYRLDENLRLGTHYEPPPLRTHFQFPHDQGSFARATTRCVGVGLCRRTEGGTMCPSYMVTREEQHSTRGRTHLLFEMLQGDPLKEGWRSESVKEALDLCLACKGCKSDCPVNVDMATYKAEFLSHYYEGRLRPRHAYAFGLIMFWARAAALVPRLANTFTQTRGLSRLARWAAGVHPERRIPAFARATLQQLARGRPVQSAKGREVILFPDTFNNHFHPDTGQSALEVLEAAGFSPRVPQGFLCCGRPLYDYGMLDTAKRLLQQVLTRFAKEIEAGVPFVVLEPSCAAVFRDELTGLFPHDQNAKRLSQQTYALSELLQKEAKDFQMPALERRAVVQGHCHHRSVLDFDSELKVLERAGVKAAVPESSCCGMAGAFGFEAGHYDVSQRCGERHLLPAVRHAGADALVVADGFSCREQIAQGTGRKALHLAQVLRLALSGARLRPGEAPETKALPNEEAPPLPLSALLAGGLGAALAGALALRPRRRPASARERLRGALGELAHRRRRASAWHRLLA